MARRLAQLGRLHEHHAADRVGSVAHAAGSAHDPDLVRDERIDLGRVLEAPLLRAVANAIDEQQQAAAELTADDRLGHAGRGAQLGDAGDVGHGGGEPLPARALERLAREHGGRAQLRWGRGTIAHLDHLARQAHLDLERRMAADRDRALGALVIAALDDDRQWPGA